jgi:hypothetical protein
MNNFEDIYNQALEMLKQGHSMEEVLVKFAAHKNELAPLLNLSMPLLTMPKNIVPTPLMKRKYAAAPAQRLWLTFTRFSKFASVSVGLVLLVSAFAATTYAANNSSAGQVLFSLKKGIENVQLYFAGSQDERASLQVAIAEKRLSEAQAVFSNPGSDADQKSAALVALADQTTSAVAQVSTVAQSDPKSSQNTPLVSSLTNITQAQASLLAQIKPDSQLQAAASSAQASLNQNSAQLSQINETIAVTDSDQALATLNTDPNAVAVLGKITKISGSQITVEKTTFNLTKDTTIQSSEGTALTLQDLSVGEKVSVIGENSYTAPLAKQILVTKDQDNNPSGSVQGDSTTTPSSPDASTTPTSTPTATPTPDSSDASSTQPLNPGTASGSFILESPNPQYAQ